MPTHCYVPGCKSGYGRGDVGKRHFFPPPKDEEMFLRWSKAIARQDWPLSSKSFVCDLHFADELIQKCDTFFIEGKKIELSRCKWILDPKAVPHIFPSRIDARRKRPKGFQMLKMLILNALKQAAYLVKVLDVSLIQNRNFIDNLVQEITAAEIRRIYRKCCVPGCHFDYESSVRLHGYVSSFTFPKDEDRKQKWICAIPRKNWLPKLSSCVCAKHFNKEDIIIEESKKLPDGTVRTFPLKRPKLKKDAVPCKFLDLTQGLGSRISDVMELNSDERYVDIETKTKNEHQQQERTLNEIKLESSASGAGLQIDQVSFPSDFISNFRDSINMCSSENKVKTKIEIKEEPCFSDRISVEMKDHPEAPHVSDDYFLSKIQIGCRSSLQE